MMRAGHLRDFGDWAQTRANFRWEVPEFFNIAEACLLRHARETPAATALIHVEADGQLARWSYAKLARASGRLANLLRARGVGPGDRVAILLSQCPEALVTHFAAHMLGAIAVPLFALFGPEALEYRLKDSGARVVVTGFEGLEKIAEIRANLPALALVLCTEGAEIGADVDADSSADSEVGAGEACTTAAVKNTEGEDFWAALGGMSDVFSPRLTRADDPACLIYTSGTTGAPKGALHAHRFLLGHLPGVETYYDFFPQKDDVCWTPADWAWIGALMDLALPALYYGVPLVSHRMRKFTPKRACEIVRTTGANVLFLPPTALKMMRAEGVSRGLGVRVISSGGESLSQELVAWCKSAFGADVNEMYGQTECNLVAGSIRRPGGAREGFMGRAIPGHRVAVLLDDGTVAAPGEEGEICVATPDPVMMLGYWNKPRETAAKIRDGWLWTGDLGVMDEDGFLRFAARSDDVISSAGYRIGPSEIEDCLAGHGDVVMAAVIGVPDALRGEAVKAFVVLREGVVSAGMEAELIARVKARVSPHLAPRSIEFRATLPMTATGKILRRALRG